MAHELRRITYIEDDDDIRALGELTLSDIGGYELQLCSNGEEAIADTPGFRPDMILIDHMMPGLDGPETFRRLRMIAALRHTPIVFMTGRGGAQDVALYRSLGAAGIVKKPFDPLTLADHLEKLWQRNCPRKDTA